MGRKVMVSLVGESDDAIWEIATQRPSNDAAKEVLAVTFAGEVKLYMTRQQLNALSKAAEFANGFAGDGSVPESADMFRQGSGKPLPVGR